MGETTSMNATARICSCPSFGWDKRCLVHPEGMVPTRKEFDALQADVRTLALIVERLVPFGDLNLHPDNEPSGYQRRVAFSLSLALKDIVARSLGRAPASQSQPTADQVSDKSVDVSPRIATPRDP